jgi:preprotein translocase subunit SecG
MESVQTVLLVAYLLIVLAMIAVILLQRSEGGGLGMGGNAGGLMTVRGSANLLTRTTAVLAALFFASAIALTILSSLNRGQTNFLDNTAPASLAPGASTAASGLPSTNVLDMLQQQQASAPAPAAETASGANDQGLALPLNLALPQVSQPAAAASDAAPAAAAPAIAPPAAPASVPPDTSTAPSVAPASASAPSQ